MTIFQEGFCELWLWQLCNQWKIKPQAEGKYHKTHDSREQEKLDSHHKLIKRIYEDNCMKKCINHVASYSIGAELATLIMQRFLSSILIYAVI